MWQLIVSKLKHNHSFLTQILHSALRKVFSEIQNTIANHAAAEIEFWKIVTALWTSNFIIQITIQNVYNTKIHLRHEALDNLTSIQTLLTNLNENYTFFYTKDLQNYIQTFFFVYKQSQKLLQINLKIFIMNCIYKTNQFRLFLFNIVNITALNTIYYVKFCFLTQKTEKNYIWTLIQMWNLYNKFKLNSSKIIVTDCKLALMNAI